MTTTQATCAFVLLSGGIDSSTCLYAALTAGHQVEAVSIDYGQRHAKEMDHARAICDHVGCTHHTLDLRSVVPRTMLTDPSAKVPDISYSDIKGVSPTYVPFRNGLMLSALASYVAGCRDLECDRAGDDPEWLIYFGAHAEDAANWAYPDCTPEFIGTMGSAIWIGTYRGVRLVTPLEWMNKADIIRFGTILGVKWDMTWSCYKGGEQHCGTCPTCRARREGFKLAGVYDPTMYLSEPATETLA